MTIQGLTDEQQRRAWTMIRPWLATLLRTAQCLARQEQDAEDLVQETVIKAMRAIDTFQPGTDEKAWLLTIMRRAHLDVVRKTGRRGTMLSLDAEQAVEPAAVEKPEGLYDLQWDSPRELLEHFEDRHVIEALQTLPDDMRWTLLLLDVEGMSVDDAAAAMGVAAGTVKSRCHRGRAMLRDRLYEFARTHGMLTKVKE